MKQPVSLLLAMLAVFLVLPFMSSQAQTVEDYRKAVQDSLDKLNALKQPTQESQTTTSTTTTRKTYSTSKTISPKLYPESQLKAIFQYYGIIAPGEVTEEDGERDGNKIEGNGIDVDVSITQKPKQDTGDVFFGIGGKYGENLVHTWTDGLKYTSHHREYGGYLSLRSYSHQFERFKGKTTYVGYRNFEVNVGVSKIETTGRTEEGFKSVQQDVMVNAGLYYETSLPQVMLSRWQFYLGFRFPVMSTIDAWQDGDEISDMKVWNKQSLYVMASVSVLSIPLSSDLGFTTDVGADASYGWQQKFVTLGGKLGVNLFFSGRPIIGLSVSSQITPKAKGPWQSYIMPGLSIDGVGVAQTIIQLF